jgi:hypothetical protein
MRGRVPALGLVMTVVAAWALLMPPLDAQPRAGSFTTMTTTDTTANSVLVGCTVGSTTCSGGIKSGPVVASTITGTTGDFSSTVTVPNDVFYRSRNSAASLLSLVGVTSGNAAAFGPSDSEVDAGVGVNPLVRGSTTVTVRTAKTDRTVWSGVNLTHTGAVRASASGANTTFGTAPEVWLVNTGASANGGKWRISAGTSNGSLQFAAIDDAESTITPVFTFSRASGGAPSDVSLGVPARLQNVLFANLPTVSTGSMVYCTDCSKTTNCSGAGAGALAIRNGGNWDCAH